MIPAARKYGLLGEKAAAKLIGETEARFTYYARHGRGPAPALVAPDGRRYYDGQTVKAWRKPKMKAKHQEQANGLDDRAKPEPSNMFELLRVELEKKAKSPRPKKRSRAVRPCIEKL